MKKGESQRAWVGEEGVTMIAGTGDFSGDRVGRLRSMDWWAVFKVYFRVRMRRVLTERCGDQGIIQTLGETVKTTTCACRRISKRVNARSHGNGKKRTLSRHDTAFICIVAERGSKKVVCERVFVRAKSLVL